MPLPGWKALIVTEIAGLSFWLDTAAVFGRGGFAEATGDYGPLVLRALIVFAACWYAFSRIRGSASAAVRRPRFSRRYLAGHVVALLVSASAMAYVFASKTEGRSADLLMTVWLSSGAAALLLGVFAVATPRATVSLVQETRTAATCAALVTLLTSIIAASTERVLWDAVALWTLEFVEAVLQPVLPVLTDATTRTLTSANFSVRITPGCSGVQALVLAASAVSGLLVFFRSRFRFPHALLLMPAGVGAASLLNAVLIAALFLVGHAGAPTVATRAFHSQAGWLLLCVGVTVVTVQRLPWIRSDWHAPDRP